MFPRVPDLHERFSRHFYTLYDDKYAVGREGGVFIWWLFQRDGCKCLIHLP